MTEVPELVTRKPTGKPPWPMILLAGGEKSGKSWAAAAFSASTLVGRTFFIEVGEHYADEYGSIPGARYEIVPHDGTYRGIGYAIWAASKQPRVDGKPNCIILDSTTLLWDLISDMAQQEANRRKGKKDGEAQITMDLWNTAKRRWNDLLAILREHDGPVILTARLEQVTVMSATGQPTTEKTMKVRAEKNLPYEVDVVVQIPAPRKYEITGLRSVSWQLKPGAAEAAPEFTVDWLLRKLGLDRDTATAPRSVTLPKPEGALQQRQPQGRQQRHPLASHEQKQQLSILIGEKLGPEAARARHNVMSQRFQRHITSFDQLTAPEAVTAIGELRKMAKYVPPRRREVYDALHKAILGADFDSLETIDRAVSSATEARDAGHITAEDWQSLSELADLRSQALIADAAGESGWDPRDGDSSVPGEQLQGVGA